MDVLIDIIKNIVNRAIDQEIQPTDLDQLHEVFDCMKDLKVRYQHEPKKKYFGGCVKPNTSPVHVATETNDKQMIDISTETNEINNNLSLSHLNDFKQSLKLYIEKYKKLEDEIQPRLHPISDIYEIYNYIYNNNPPTNHRGFSVGCMKLLNMKSIRKTYNGKTTNGFYLSIKQMSDILKY